MVMRVCVIGAGPAGLVSLRYLTENPGVFDVVAFEQTSEVGGTWAYEENDGVDERGQPVHSAMYPDLITNLPKEIMEFPDFPYPEDLPSYIHCSHVRRYYEDFCEKFALRKYIQFQRKVIEVKPIVDDTGDASRGWEVKVEAMTHGKDVAAERKTYQFDAVMVCNGHYSTPKWPSIPGLTMFIGDLRHSFTYRHPENYSGKTVAVLSAGLSAMDIANTLTSHAKHVYHCCNTKHSKICADLIADNLTTCTGITEVKASSVILEDGKQLEVDAIIICTGYIYSFPFLTPECHINVENNRVTPLYKHIIHTKYPTLGFIGLVRLATHFDLQVRFFLASLTGMMALPSREKMDKEDEEDFEATLRQGLPPRVYHQPVPPLLGTYNQDLSLKAGIPGIPLVYEKVYMHALNGVLKDYAHYRQVNYSKVDDDNYELA